MVGAVTVGGGAALATAPAQAATVTVPGIGNIAVPDVPGVQAMPTVPGIPGASYTPSPEAGSFLPFGTHGAAALAAARTRVGSPYVWGASGPNAFDCSGLVQWSYRQAGVGVPRTSYEQARGGIPVSQADLQPGDVVILSGGGHAALYAGNGQILHAPQAGQPVRYSPLASQSFFAARRY